MPLQITLHITVRHGKLNNTLLGCRIYIICQNASFEEKAVPHGWVYSSYILFSDVVRYFYIQAATLSLEHIWHKTLV